MHFDSKKIRYNPCRHRSTDSSFNVLSGIFRYRSRRSCGLLSLYPAVVVILMLLGGCSSDTSPNAIAFVDGNPITTEALSLEIDRRALRVHNRERQQQVLDELIYRELLYTAAVKEGFDKKFAAQEAVKRVIADAYRQELLVPRIDAVSVTDAEIESYYHEHSAAYTKPAMVRVAVIQIRVPVNCSDETRERLWQKAATAHKAATDADFAIPDFGPLAVQYSEDQSSRYRGGDTGWLRTDSTGGRWERRVMDAASSLIDPGEISPVVTGEEGLYVIRLIDRKESTLKPLEEVADGIRRRLKSSKKEMARTEFFDEMKNRFPVITLTDALPEIHDPLAQESSGPPPLPAM